MNTKQKVFALIYEPIYFKSKFAGASSNYLGSLKKICAAYSFLRENTDSQSCCCVAVSSKNIYQTIKENHEDG